MAGQSWYNFTKATRHRMEGFIIIIYVNGFDKSLLSRHTLLRYVKEKKDVSTQSRCVEIAHYNRVRHRVNWMIRNFKRMADNI